MVIALVNHKGGVGKTTCALNIGAGLRRMGKSVLLIDADAQANLTTCVGLSQEEPITLYDIMLERTTLEESIVKRENAVDIVPASLELTVMEGEFAARGTVRREEILRRALKSVRLIYDYILIDCPPTLDICTKNALAAADEVYIPVSAEFLPMKGLSRILEMIDLFQRKEINADLRVSGVIVTRYNKQQTICKNIAEELQARFGETLFRTYIRENVALKESPAMERDVFAYAPHSLAAADYGNLVNEILEREHTSTLKQAVREQVA
jgi:chromosome partitioning protein